MNIVPSNKFDDEVIQNLQKADDEEVLQHCENLLEWLQDYNWPVFEKVAARLSPFGDQLHEPICSILLGADSIWKANIVGHLIPKFSQSSQKKYDVTLGEMLRNPSASDYEEGLIDFIEIQLARHEKNT